MERHYRLSNSTQHLNQTNFSLDKINKVNHSLYCLDYSEFKTFYNKIRKDSDDIVILDTRPDEETNSGIIPHSIISNSNFCLGKLVSKKSQILLITEDGFEEDHIHRLISLGYKNVIGYLDGGIDTWIQRKQMLTLPKYLEHPETFQKLDSIIDCREQREWNYGVMKCNDIVLMQVDQIPKSCYSLDASKSYGVYCKRGMRSLAVTSYLMFKGFNVTNIPGGFINWVFKNGKGQMVKKLIR